MSRQRGIIGVAAGAICFSTVIIFSRLTQGLEGGALAFFRTFFAFLFFLCLQALPGTRIHRPPRATWGLLSGLGLAVGVSALLYIYAIRHTTAANAALLINTSAVYVALLAPWLLHESPQRYRWPGLILAMLGVIGLVAPAGLDLRTGDWTGLLAGILSGGTYAATMLFSRALRSRVDSHTQTFWSTALAALLLLPWGLQSSPEAFLANLPLLIPLGVISLGLAYWLYFTGLQAVPAQIVSLIALLEPLSGVLIGLFIFNEIPTPIGALGSLCILAGIYLITR